MARARKESKFEVYGEEMLEKLVAKSGSSGRVYLPPDWIGRRVKVISVGSMWKGNKQDGWPKSNDYLPLVSHLQKNVTGRILIVNGDPHWTGLDNGKVSGYFPVCQVPVMNMSGGRQGKWGTERWSHGYRGPCGEGDRFNGLTVLHFSADGRIRCEVLTSAGVKELSMAIPQGAGVRVRKLRRGG